jgi:TPR repeat protein
VTAGIDGAGGQAREVPTPVRATWGGNSNGARRRNPDAVRESESDAIRQRIESENDPDAAFDLGVMLYEAGDLQGARTAWQRSVERGHRRAAVNLGFLLQRMGDRKGAREAYLKAAEWGDPVAARLAEGLAVRTDNANHPP